MPTYDYRCENCGKFQIMQSIKEKPLTQCPTCGKSVHRVIGKNVNVILKGSGFYSTDNRKESSTGDDSANKAS
jgi:putative FmdB family regulatory protein